MPAVHRFSTGGAPADVTAVFAHATGFHGRVWDPTVRRLTGVDAHAVDLRGHGDTRMPEGYDFPWSAFGDDVLSVVDGLPTEARDGEVVGVGHSCGGAALVLAEAARPGTFRSLWLYEPAAFPPPAAGQVQSNPLVEPTKRRRAVFPDRAEAYRNYASKPPMDAFAPEVLAAYVDHGFVDEGDGVRLKCRPLDEAQVYVSSLVADVFEAMAKVHCPVVLVQGVETPSGRFGRLAEQFPNARLEVHPDLAHFGPLTHPERVAASIASWLDEGAWR
ncbi:alpha/beta fold hydrolase [Yinghuangia seranimata]|uniref:alpha/beta fold hydrolase n=1 Tax=Yinghuangia seranimata TaxID=408067 RepID=UPI00248BB405|nr:alpha/beta hydrolase [Yinghuangia seranimata]MDI2129785.1 alpha/beta hydrolase [Yinghuangia seranimata]